MKTDSRQEILQRIRAQTATMTVPPIPPTPEVWPSENPGVEALAARFESELLAVQGEIVLCGSEAELADKMAEFTLRQGWKRLAVMEREDAIAAASKIDCATVERPKEDWSPREMAELDASVVSAEALLADTGSCLIACGTGEDRLLCYLPPACMIVAKRGRIFENMPTAWKEFAARMADRYLRGEYVIVTGPSRTADIEKTLILGVHGPKRLIVFLYD